MAVSQEQEDKQVEKYVEKYKEDLLSGRVFALHAVSHRSRYGYQPGYQPPLGHRQYAHMIEALGLMARQSDRMAQIVSNVVHKINLYGDAGQACAAVYEGAFKAVHSGYTDVVGRSGPEAGRASDYEHQYTLRDLIQAQYWLEYVTKGATSSGYGVGWVTSRIAKEINYVPEHALGYDAEGKVTY